MYFFLECEGTYGLQTLCKTQISGKNLVFKLWPKSLLTNQNAGIIKLLDRTNNLRYKLKILYVVKHL